MLLSHSVPGLAKKIYVGTPTWGNYEPLFELAGFEVYTCKHYDPQLGTVAWDSVIQTVRSASESSVFVFQESGHNPSGADFTKD